LKAVSETGDFASRLAEWLADELGDPGVRIEGLRRTSAGFSRENWVFDAAWTAQGATQTASLIARRDPPGSVLVTDRQQEGAVLHAMEYSPVPTPRVRWLDAHGVRLGRPAVIMDLVKGVCDGFVLNGSRPLERRVDIAHRLYDHLAEIHRFDWRAHGLDKVLEDPGPGAATVAVDHWERELRAVQLEPEPELEVVLAWLRAHAPRAQVTTLVHGDFKAGNVLLRDDDVVAVLDWETAHLGDPLEDIGWVTNPLRAGEHRIAGVWEPEDLIRRWSDRTGFDADEPSIEWWRVLANLKLSVIVLTGVHAFVDGRLDRCYHSPVRLYQLLLDQIGA
jgi:aminoglycoside phosphotransferase (APT) family kinase protein